MTKKRTVILSGFFGVALAACAGSAPVPDSDDMKNRQPSAEYDLASLKALSCPAGADFVAPDAIKLSVLPLPLSSNSEARALPEGVTFHAGWVLESSDTRFGGLSGMAMNAAGQFLMVSDTGAFVWIDRNDDGAPTQIGAIAEMKDATGRSLKGKTEADAEGLAVSDGLAFVSFERNHRIEAFDLKACGAAARSALVTSLPSTIETDSVHENRGPEALALRGTLVAGYEQSTSAGGTALFALNAAPQSVDAYSLDALPAPFDGPLTGMTNRLGDVAYAVRRRYFPATGNQITVEMATSAEITAQSIPLFELSRPQNVDNFEGIAAEELEDGTHRIWLVSDDNFSSRQRTLLFAFDIDATKFNTATTHDDTQ